MTKTGLQVDQKILERRKRNREYAAKRYAERRRAIDAIKVAAGCVDCGYRENPVALAFDHKDRKKKSFKIASGIATRTWSSLLNEIAKCDVRCHNCHAIKTFENEESEGRPRNEF